MCSLKSYLRGKNKILSSHQESIQYYKKRVRSQFLGRGVLCLFIQGPYCFLNFYVTLFFYFCKHFFYDCFFRPKHKSLLLVFGQSVLCCFQFVLFRDCFSWASLPNLLTNILFPKVRSLASRPLPGIFLSSCPTFLVGFQYSCH